MSRKTVYNKNISAPAEITNEEYESVGASKFQLGDSRRFFLGANDFEVYTEPSTGTKLVEGVDYQLLDLDANLSTLCAKPVFSSLIILNAEYQNCKLYLNYRCVLSQLDAKQMNAMQLQIDANKSLNETQSTILTDHESRITANAEKNTEQDEAHAAHVNNSEIHVTAADKSRWDGKANTYLVDDIAARDALTGLNINDVVFVKDDGDGKRAGYYYNGPEETPIWEKFSDPDWENVSLEWSAIENVPQVLKDFSDDGTGLKYKGADIGTGGNVTTADTSATDGEIVVESGTTGKAIKKSGKAIGNASGNVPLANGTKCANLFAEYSDHLKPIADANIGKTSTAFTSYCWDRGAGVKFFVNRDTCSGFTGFPTGMAQYLNVEIYGRQGDTLKVVVRDALSYATWIIHLTGSGNKPWVQLTDASGNAIAANNVYMNPSGSSLQSGTMTNGTWYTANYTGHLYIAGNLSAQGGISFLVDGVEISCFAANVHFNLSIPIKSGQTFAISTSAIDSCSYKIRASK